MGFAGRHYGPLLIGLVGAAAVLFTEPLSRFLEAALAAVGISGLVAIPAMALVLWAVLLHDRARQADRAQRVQRDREAIAGDVRRAEERARELEQLVRLGEALGATLDPKAIHQTVTRHLQPVIGQRDIWNDRAHRGVASCDRWAAAPGGVSGPAVGPGPPTGGVGYLPDVRGGQAGGLDGGWPDGRRSPAATVRQSATAPRDGVRRWSGSPSRTPSCFARCGS